MMALKPRVIPCLLLSGEGLVKTQGFAQGTYVGDPINAVKIFNESEVDELIVLDILASKKGREPDFAMVERLTTECFMPLCFGGGLSDFSHAERLFSLGVEKVALNHILQTKFSLLGEIARVYGNQSVVASVDVSKSFFGKTEVYSHVLSKTIKLGLVDWVRKLEDSGAGEILLNSVELDGQMKGYDLDVIRRLSEAVSVPLIALGGAGSLADLTRAIEAGASAAAAGSLFVFHGRFRAVLINYPTQAELAQLFSPT